MDPRTTPANGRVAAQHLKGLVDAERYTEGAAHQLIVPLADLLHTPHGKRERQLLMGDHLTVYDVQQGYAYVQAQKDGYVGYIPSEMVAPIAPATHKVSMPSTHAYSEPDIKAPEVHPLYFGSTLAIKSHSPGFFETAAGTYIPKPALRPIDRLFQDPVTVAQLFFGAPYLWGGNSVAGLDCSGLVQLAYHACGQPSPGDSDQQEGVLGTPISADTPRTRGDLLFWKGHVALAVDADTLIHANAFHMSVAYEPAEQAIHRISVTGGGPVTSVRRPRAIGRAKPND